MSVRLYAKCDNFIRKCDSYYKIVHFITKYQVYYKMRPHKQVYDFLEMGNN